MNLPSCVLAICAIFLLLCEPQYRKAFNCTSDSAALTSTRRRPAEQTMRMRRAQRLGVTIDILMVTAGKHFVVYTPALTA